MKRSGTADLPLHYGHVPEWLHTRMTLIGREIIRALVHESGPSEVLRRLSDPARYAFAHGGKDGHPFPVPLKVYDESISVLRTAVNAAKIDRSEKLRGFNALHRMALMIEKNCDPFADVDRAIDFERRHSHEYGGMMVTGPAAKPPAKEPAVVQLSLFED